MKRLMLTAVCIAGILGLSSPCAFAATTPTISHLVQVTHSTTSHLHVVSYGVRPIWDVDDPGDGDGGGE